MSKLVERMNVDSRMIEEIKWQKVPINGLSVCALMQILSLVNHV